MSTKPINYSHHAPPPKPRSHSLVEIEVSQVLRGVLGQGHLLIIEYDPAVIFENVTHIVAHGGRRAHVGDKAHQLVAG